MVYIVSGGAWTREPSYDGEGEPAKYGRENELDHETL